MRTALVLALFVNFIFGDEICENTDGDLFFISNPIGSFMQHLKVDDHEYTVQITTPRGFGEESINLYFKERFKSKDKIEINQQQFLLDLVGKYGFKDVELQRNIGFQKRIKGSPEDPEASCYYYQCDASVANVDCNLTPNTESCKLDYAKNANNITFEDGTKARFYGQCVMHLTSVTINLFDIWLQSALREGLPDITVLENYVTLDWGEAAPMFPEGTYSLYKTSNITTFNSFLGKITYDLSFSNDSKRISTKTLAPQIIFTNLELTMTVELEQNTPKENRIKCVEYARDPQTTEEKCKADENCEFSTLMWDCTWRRTKKVNKTYKIPVKARKTSNS